MVNGSLKSLIYIQHRGAIRKAPEVNSESFDVSLFPQLYCYIENDIQLI